MAVTVRKILDLPKDEREYFYKRLTSEEAEVLLYSWEFWRRQKQALPAGEWRSWLILSGRGWGKTLTGAQTIRQLIEGGRARRVALVAPTAADARDTMVEGESGILAISPPWNMPEYEPSKRRLTWPNGAIATLYSADQPDRLRGPQHDFAWADELASWRHLREAWDNLMLGLRLGEARSISTTTPRPLPVVKELIDDDDTMVTTGNTYENIENLSENFRKQILRRYEGTRIGRQELWAEILDDTPGALWNRDILEETRVREAPELVRIVVAVDPEATSNENSNETGIVAAGVDRRSHGYVLEDRSVKASPNGWATRAVQLFHELGADRIVAESNQGGEMVEHTIRTVDPKVPIKLIHASRGKQTRAEPIAALYEQAKVHHVGLFGKLEDQLTSWVPGDDSPDRLDAMVHACSYLLLSKRQHSKVKPQSSGTRISPWKV